MAAEWGWNPEAVGAIGSAVGALLAAVAAFIAVLAGVIQPRKMQHDLQRRQLLMLGPRLRGELSAMQFQLGWFRSRWPGKEDYPRAGYASMASALNCPALTEILASGTLFPEAETRMMTRVQEDSHLLASMMLTESKLFATLPGPRQMYEDRLEQLLIAVTELLESLNSLAGIKRESFIPQPPSS